MMFKTANPPTPTNWFLDGGVYRCTTPQGYTLTVTPREGGPVEYTVVVDNNTVTSTEIDVPTAMFNAVATANKVSTHKLVGPYFHRETLYHVLDGLGADGTFASLNELSTESAWKAIFDHVGELEKRAYEQGFEDGRIDAGALPSGESGVAPAPTNSSLVDPFDGATDE